MYTHKHTHPHLLMRLLIFSGFLSQASLMNVCSSCSNSFTEAALICPKPMRVASWISVKSTRNSGITTFNISVKDTDDCTTDGRNESNASRDELLSGEDATSEA